VLNRDAGQRADIAAARCNPHLRVMIFLIRARECLSMSPDAWQAVQGLAKGEGWSPGSAEGADAGVPNGTYTAGRTVSAVDAAQLADALEKGINSETTDSSEFDVAQLVGFVNFLRGGVVEIQ
jgi:hypothetical protein